MLTQEERVFVAEAAKELVLPYYLEQNLQTAIAALKLLGVGYTMESFQDARLFGRLTRVLPNVLLDVGHNPLAAGSIAKVLEGKKVVLVYNSFKDKDYHEILSRLLPVIKRVEILEVTGQRVEEKVRLQKTLKDLKIQYADFHQIEQNEKYLVFGSFSVAEEFLKRINA